MKQILVLLAASVLLASCASSQKASEAEAKASAEAQAAAEEKAKSEAEAAEKEKAAKANRTECARDQDTRVLEIASVQPKGCELNYTKFGNTEAVASSAVGLEHCQTVRDRIRGKLEEAGYKCQ